MATNLQNLKQDYTLYIIFPVYTEEAFHIVYHTKESVKLGYNERPKPHIFTALLYMTIIMSPMFSKGSSIVHGWH